MSFLSNITNPLTWLSGDIAIDLGTANTLLWMKGKGVMINEPSIVARSVNDRNIIAVGNKAKAMLGRTHRDIETIRPLRDGVIADFDMTDGMLLGFIKMINISPLARMRMVICVPSGVTEVERRAVKDSGLRANAREVFLIEEPVAAAIGIGLDISQPVGNIIVDIGGGTTEIAVIALSGVDGSVSSNPEEVSKMVSTLIQGMSVALYTTLVGSICSVWLNICYQIMSTGANNLLSKIIELGEKK